MDVSFFALQMSNKCLTNVQTIDGKFSRFLRYLCNKNSDQFSAICIYYGRFIESEISNQIFNFCSKVLDKLFAKISSFLGNLLHIACVCVHVETGLYCKQLFDKGLTLFIKYFESPQVICLALGTCILRF
jgi:hypothetical protein